VKRLLDNAVWRTISNECIDSGFRMLCIVVNRVEAVGDGLKEPAERVVLSEWRCGVTLFLSKSRSSAPKEVEFGVLDSCWAIGDGNWGTGGIGDCGRGDSVFGSIDRLAICLEVGPLHVIRLFNLELEGVLRRFDVGEEDCCVARD
jgi:hypothetical protein